MASIMEAAKHSPETIPVSRYVQVRRAMNLYFAERPDDPNVMRYKRLKEERANVLQRCNEEVLEQCAIPAEKWVRRVVDYTYWRQWLWIGDIRKVVIGNISLDCTVQADDSQAWCAHEFRFKQ